MNLYLVQSVTYKPSWLKLILMLFFLCGSTACTNSRLNDFNQFGAAGAAFSDGIKDLTANASKLAVDSDSAFLKTQKLLLKDPSQRQTRIDILNSHSRELREYIHSLALFSQHTRLLNNYFNHLTLLASQNHSQEIENGLVALIPQLDNLGVSIQNAKVGQAQISELLQSFTHLAVGRLQSSLLERELKSNGDSLMRHIQLQRTYITALTSQMEADILVLNRARELSLVANSYIEDAPLPVSWVDNRRKIYLEVFTFSSPSKAIEASSKLENMLRRLAEGKPLTGEYFEVIESINEALKIFGSIKGI